jgi:hypothetical protein
LTEIKSFSYSPEEGQNPYIGFMSFQHFRGEKMYSDIVVRPEANRTETERVECYPISPDAEENGKGEGYYPDTSVVYIRILWKEFEPKRGEYNYSFIENILNEARAHSQSLIFRLMAHSTRASDDVPEWLKELIPCPERPDGERIKDSPTHPLFLELFLEAVRRFGERFDSDPTLDAIDISLPGAWGEGYKLELYPSDVFERIMDTYTSVFKNTQLMTQLARPNLIRYAKESANLNVGWRGDGLGDPHHIYEVYPDKVKAIEDNWKTAPVAFESYWWLGEWKRQGWDIDEIIDKTLEWHISSMNAKSMPAPTEWKDKIDYWVSKMGYHFSFGYLKYGAELSKGEDIELELSVNNVGVAPIYKELPLKVRLVSDNAEYVFDTDVDVRRWLPGEHIERIKLPSNGIAPDRYRVDVGIISNDTVIYFATDAKRCGKYYTLAEITVR